MAASSSGGARRPFGAAAAIEADIQIFRKEIR
jgi:hypothetical protein